MSSLLPPPVMASHHQAQGAVAGPCPEALPRAGRVSAEGGDVATVDVPGSCLEDR